MPMATRSPNSKLILAVTMLLLPLLNLVRGRAQDQTPLLLSSALAFVSTRDNPSGSPVFTTELYVAAYTPNDVAAERLTNLRRLTNNNFGDAFPSLSPDGSKLVFDSNRLFESPALNTADLFVMDWDGENLAYVTRGSSATWSPDSRTIAYHASASGTGRYIRSDPGSATIDSDIFVINVDDAVAGSGIPVNITNNPLTVDDDPDWSPDGTKILFTRHNVTDNHQNPRSAEIWVMNADGTGQLQLTHNVEEERAPAWSPDGTRIIYSCRRGTPATATGPATFEICVMNADGSGELRLTNNAVGDLTPTWSPEGDRIIYHVSSAGLLLQLYELRPDGTGTPQQLTTPPGLNGLANWGSILTHVIASPARTTRAPAAR
jgi:TolB protein